MSIKKELLKEKELLEELLNSEPNNTWYKAQLTLIDQLLTKIESDIVN